MTRKIKKLLKDFDISSFRFSGGMGGGDSGVPDDLLTTKGDTHGYSTTNARVPIGIDDQVLTADSTDALGLAWKSAGGGTELNDLTAVGTYSPTKQDGLMHVVADLDGITSGNVKYYNDGSLIATYDSTSTGQYNEIINPSTSIQWTAAALTFADTTYTGNTGNLSGSGIIGNGYCMDFSPTGEYAVYVGSKRMLSFTNSVTPLDLSTYGGYTSYDTYNFDGGGRSIYIYSCKFLNDGAYIAVGNGTTIYRVTTDNGAYKWTSNQCGTDGQRLSFDTSGTGSSTTYGLDFNHSDGSKFYISHAATADIIYEYDMSTAWDITTASYNGVSYTTGMSASDMRCFVFSKDGQFLFTTTGAAGSTLLYRHTLSTPWDLSTASSTDSINIGTLTGSAAKINGGMVMYNNDSTLAVMNESSGGGNTMYALNLQLIFGGNFKTAVS